MSSRTSEASVGIYFERARAELREGKSRSRQPLTRLRDDDFRDDSGMTAARYWYRSAALGRTVSSMSRSATYYVYILASHSRCVYVGVTRDLERRVWEHKNGVVAGFTK